VSSQGISSSPIHQRFPCKGMNARVIAYHNPLIHYNHIFKELMRISGPDIYANPIRWTAVLRTESCELSDRCCCTFRTTSKRYNQKKTNRSSRTDDVDDDFIYTDPSPKLDPGLRYKCDDSSIWKGPAICSCSSSSPCCLAECLPNRQPLL